MQKNPDLGIGKRILLADDDKFIMAVMSEFLQLAGYAVTEAADGAAAWELLAGGTEFDLLITDRRMPNMDGLQLAMMVRGDARLFRLPVIILTGAAAQGDIAEGVSAGQFCYLAKPVEEEELLAAVHSALRG